MCRAAIDLSFCVAEGLVRYSSNAPADIPDRSYDGSLGQLTDGLEGPDSFQRYDSDEKGKSPLHSPFIPKNPFHYKYFVTEISRIGFNTICIHVTVVS